MTVETATYISQLNAALPAASDPVGEGEDHLQLIKSVLQSQFTSLGAAAVTTTAAELNYLDITTLGTSQASKALTADASGNVTIDTTTLYVDAANNRVGVGTVTPTTDIDVTGASGQEQAVIASRVHGAASGGAILRLETYNDSGAGYNSIIQLRKSNTDTLGALVDVVDGQTLGQIHFAGISRGNTAYHGGAYITAIVDGTEVNYTPTNLVFHTTSPTAINNNALVVHNSGKIGIGTSAPQDGIEFKSSASRFNFTNPSIAHGMTGWAPTDAGVSIYTGATGGFVVEGYSDNDSRGVIIYGTIGVTDPTDTTPAIVLNGMKKNVSTPQALGASETALQVSTFGTHLMTVLGGGNVGIGLVNPAHAIDVVGTAGLDTGTAWTNTSDSRIKTNVQTITGAIDKIKQLRPVSFNYTDQYLSAHPGIDGAKTYNSFIAEEYESVFPDAVSVGHDLEDITPAELYVEEDDIPEGKGVGDVKTKETRETLIPDLKQYTPHDLNMYLVAAVQELEIRLAALEAS